MGTEMERSRVRAVDGVEEAEPTPARIYVAEPVKGEYTRPEWHRWAVSTIDALRFALHGALGRYRISGRSLIERELKPMPPRWLEPVGDGRVDYINPEWALWADGNMEYWYGRALSASDLLKRTLTQCSFVELPVGERLRTLVERFLGVTTEGAMGEDRTVADLRHELETITRDRDAANLRATEAHAERSEMNDRLEEARESFSNERNERDSLRAKLDEAMALAKTMTAQRNEARADLDTSMGRTRVLSRLLWQAHGVMLNTAPMVHAPRGAVLKEMCSRIAAEVGHTPTEGDTSMGLPTEAERRAEAAGKRECRPLPPWPATARAEPEITPPFGEREAEPLFVGSSPKTSKLPQQSETERAVIAILEAVLERGDELAAQLSPNMEEVKAWRRHRPDASKPITDNPHAKYEERDRVLMDLKEANLKRATDKLKHATAGLAQRDARIGHLEEKLADAVQRVKALALTIHNPAISNEMAPWCRDVERTLSDEVPF